MRKTKILLVDDQRANLVALTHIIAAPEVEILAVESAADALALLLDHEFALAILDVQMPDINGFELAGLMRSAERSRGIPIIFVTASERETGHIFAGYDNGAVDYLLKPLAAHVVRSKVRVFVELDQKTKALEQKLREVEALRQVAESANRAKSRFLANMSHEIRTPLGAVLGYADLLSLPEQSAAESAYCISAISRNGRLLLQLVNDVLDLSKIEAEAVQVERAPTALSDLVSELKTVHGHRAAEKGLVLEILANGPLPLTVVTDALRLKQILHNVVGNAVKFTDRGRVSVKISYAAGRVGGNLIFCVVDSGCGLSPTEVDRIFHPFVQVDDSSTRRFAGTGLGLAISKQLATLLGGTVVLAGSQLGVGSTFVISVDAGIAAAADLVDGDLVLQRQPELPVLSADLPVRLDGVRVLIADDALDNRHLLTRVLTRAGAVVDTAADGSEAVDKALAGAYDVILMDIQMPGTDGYEATARLRRQGYKRPILALTAHVMKEELKRCREAGCDHHLSKPVNSQSLIACVADYAARAVAAPVV